MLKRTPKTAAGSLDPPTFRLKDVLIYYPLASCISSPSDHLDNPVTCRQVVPRVGPPDPCQPRLRPCMREPSRHGGAARSRRQ